MEQELNNDEFIARYLLGELSEQERERVIDRYLADDEFFEQMLSVEEDLISDYARDQLPRPQRERFEERYLTTPQGLHRVKRAKAFANAISEAQRPKPLWVQSLLGFIRGPYLIPKYSLAAATLLVSLGGAWLVVDRVRLRNQIGRSQAEQAALEQKFQRQVAEQRGQGERLASELQRAQDQLRQVEAERAELQRRTRELLKIQGQTRLPSTQLALFELTASSIKERGPSKELVIGAGADLVKLQLNLEGEKYKNYRIYLRTITGDDIFSQSGLKAQPTKTGSAVVVSFSPTLVVDGDYVLTLSGITDTGAEKEAGQWYLKFINK